MLQDVVEQRSVSTLHGKARDGRNDGRQQLSRLLAEVVVEGAADSKETEMNLVTLSRGKHPLAVCNDGNSAGYYFKVGIDSLPLPRFIWAPHSDVLCTGVFV